MAVTSLLFLQNALSRYEQTAAQERKALLQQDSLMRSLAFLNWLAQHKAASPSQHEVIHQLGNELLHARHQPPDPVNFPKGPDVPEDGEALIHLSPGWLQRGPWTVEGEAMALKQVVNACHF
jgi:hypothetical protein